MFYYGHGANFVSYSFLKLRYRKDKSQFKVKPVFPVVKEVKDLSSGCAVAAVIHYYCPGLLRLEGTNKYFYCHKKSFSIQRFSVSLTFFFSLL